MALKPPVPGLRVFHNSKTAQKVDIVVPPGAELEVPVGVAFQLKAASTHFEVNEADYEEARREEGERADLAAEESAAAHFLEYHRIREPVADDPVSDGDEPKEKPSNVCPVCGFEAKSAGGLSSHAKTHENEQEQGDV